MLPVIIKLFPFTIQRPDFGEVAGEEEFSQNFVEMMSLGKAKDYFQSPCISVDVLLLVSKHTCVHCVY